MPVAAMPASSATPLSSEEKEQGRRGRGRSPLSIARHLLPLCLLIGATLLAADWGLQLRKWTYEQTPNLRHGYDIRHNLLYGGRAIDDGVLDLYGNIQKENPSGKYGLDYVPLRLITMRQWAAWVRAHYGKDAPWQPDFEFTSPLLYFNTGMEAISAIAIFLLICLWIRRSDRAEARELARPGSAAFPADGSPVALSPWRGCLAGFVGAMLMWFSPASQFSAHAWPSWDIWIVPFYLCTALLACVNWWFCAGMVLGIGTMFKGQQLMVVPLFLLWPLFMGRVGAALRWGAGYIFAVAVIVSPWLLRDGTTRLADHGAMAWVAGGLIACLIPLIGRWMGRDRTWRWSTWWRVGTAVAAAGLMIWPGFLARNHGYAWIAALLAAGVVGFTWYLPPRRFGYLAAGIVGLCLALCPVFFSGDLTWWDVAFRYGSEKFPGLAQWASNALPSLLQLRFGWHSLQDVVYTIPAGFLWFWPKAPVEVPMRIALVGLYSICLTLCAVGMARHSRRADRHFLAAMAAPWVLAFVFMPQMHGRYLLFGASAGALMAGVGVGMVMLDLVLIVLAWLMTIQLLTWGGPRRIHDMTAYLGDWARPVYNFYSRGWPDLGWVVILIALIFLYVGLVSSRRRRRWRIGEKASKQIPGTEPSRPAPELAGALP